MVTIHKQMQILPSSRIIAFTFQSGSTALYGYSYHLFGEGKGQWIQWLVIGATFLAYASRVELKVGMEKINSHLPDSKFKSKADLA